MNNITDWINSLDWTPRSYRGEIWGFPVWEMDTRHGGRCSEKDPDTGLVWEFGK